MNKKSVLLGAGLFLSAATALAQQVVTGKVVDSQGEPVMGATVRVHGTKITTTTDVDGNFKLNNVPASAKKIAVSFIGMQAQTVSVAGNVQVVLKDNELGEAVVVGYGSAKKVGTLVGSVKKVGSDVIAGKPSVNVADALQGQVAGMQVNSNSGDAGAAGDMSIVVRGNGSLTASNSPLIVVDGSPAGGVMLSMLSSSDIESVTTLKDASATSIYGSRAANGVIYITTKKGRKNEKATITLSQRAGWSQLARSIGNPMSADELLNFQLENNVITPQQYAEFKAHGANTDWQKWAFDNAAPMISTDFSIRGGSENTNYFVSASFLDQDGITLGSDYRRYTLRTNIESKLNDWLSFGINQSVGYTERSTNRSTTNGSIYLDSYSTVANSYPRYWDPFDPNTPSHRIWGNEQILNPKWVTRANNPHQSDIVYNGTAYLQVTPFKGMTLRSQLGLFATDTRFHNYMSPSSAELVGAQTGVVAQALRSSQWTITNTAEYKFNLGENHHFTLLAGQEGIKADGREFTATADKLTDDRFNLLSHALVPALPSESRYKYEYLSFFGRVDYNLKDKYYANFTVRNDQCSRFGAANRSAMFYSGGLMWDVMAEKFMRPFSSWLTGLQLKASVGSTGNSGIGDYGHLGLAGITRYGDQLGFTTSSFESPELGWEKQIQFNFGFNASFFGRLDLDVNAYYRKTKDMLMSVPLPGTTGQSSEMQNVGKMSNRGVEVELSYNVIRSKDWNVNLYGVYSYNVNRIDELFHGLKEWPNGFTSLIVGESMNFYLPIFAGVDETDGAPMWYKKGYNGDAGYVFNPETMTKDASQIEFIKQDTGKKLYAPHNGGFGFSVAWKGLSLNADFSYMLGKYMLNKDYLMSTITENAAFNMDRDLLTDMWTKPGDHAKLPGFGQHAQFDTHVLENSSFMRLKNLTLAYELPKSWIEATRFFKNIRVNFTARNLFTVTKYKGADPELNAAYAVGGFPATRDYTFGIDVSF